MSGPAPYVTVVGIPVEGEPVEVLPRTAECLIAAGWTPPTEEREARPPEFSKGGILPASTLSDTGKIRIHAGTGGPWPPRELAS